MRHFISFVKRKGFYVPAGTSRNQNLAYQINHELMTYGYIMTKELVDRLATQDETYLNALYNDVKSGLVEVVGGDGYEPIYKNFPQSVKNLSYSDFVANALVHYWSRGTWRPEDEEHIHREFAIEVVDYKDVTLLNETEFNSIFTDLLYAPTSISAFDKRVIDWYLNNGYAFDFSKITFKEISAYVGKRLLDDETVTTLPTKSATTVLRILAAYNGGDEGLKTNTKFGNPSNRQVRVLQNTLNQCYDLEESFKGYREMWLRVLYYLNPMTNRNKTKYPNLYSYAEALRNNPKTLKTFNSKLESLLLEKDEAVFDLLKNRMGVFTRRLDHLVRLFGLQAIERWLVGNPNFMQLVNAYNHFSDRDKLQASRGAVLASQDKSKVVSYEALEPLDSAVVEGIKDLIISKVNQINKGDLGTSKIYIDKSLYYRPLPTNNRASSMSLDGQTIGTCESIPDANTIRLYVHWHNRYDIDLSALVIHSDGSYAKVGWNGNHSYKGAIVYSGDNTGYAEKNAEYLDIVPSQLDSNVEWIILEARIFSGPRDYASFEKPVRAGWMLRDKPEAGTHWKPETIANSMVLSSKANEAYLTALHLPTNSLIYLDLAMSGSRVSSSEDAYAMANYLTQYLVTDSDDIVWDKIKQGHILNLLSKEVVDTIEDADVVFDKNTTAEQVLKYLNVSKEVVLDENYS